MNRHPNRAGSGRGFHARNSLNGPLPSVQATLDALKSGLGVAYLVAAGIGGLMTLAYMWMIGFYPSNMTPGEVLFFLLVALSFAFVYLLLIGCGAFGVLWFLNAMELYRNAVSYDDRAIAEQLFGEHGTPVGCAVALRDAWRRARLRATRGRVDSLMDLPAPLKEWFFNILSLILFVFVVLVAWESEAVAFTEFVATALLAGFITLLFASMRSASASPKMARARLVGMVLVPAVIVMCFLGLRPLLNIVFQQIGIHASGVSLEIPIGESGAIERIAAHVNRPLVDCRQPGPAKVLVHGVDVLWTGIGNQTVVRFNAIGAKRTKIFSQAPEEPYVQRTFDTDAIRILKSKPKLDPCFSITVETLFAGESATLGRESQRELSNLAKALAHQGAPRRIVVRSRYLSRPSAELSELRANAVVAALRPLIGLRDVEFIAAAQRDEVAGSECGTDSPATSCKSNSARINISAEYRR